MLRRLETSLSTGLLDQRVSSRVKVTCVKLIGHASCKFSTTTSGHVLDCEFEFSFTKLYIYCDQGLIWTSVYGEELSLFVGVGLSAEGTKVFAAFC